MRARRCGALLAAAAITLLPSAHSAATPSGTRLLFRLGDPRLGEASGIVAGIASPGVVYVQNDGGDSARFFALDARTGRTRATYTVPGATNVDWEDIAVAPDARGVPSVWIGDIGDNDGQRSTIEIYRVDEPHVDVAAQDVAATTAAPEVWRLRYPGGATDAESLAVAPNGTPYIVTKSLLGASTVYSAPRRADGGRVQQLRQISSVHFAFTGTPGPFAPAGEMAATGADISRDGSLLTVRTYTDAYVWRIRDGDVAAAVRTKPVRLALPEQPQGEGIAFAGSRLLVDSEQVGSAVYSVPIPAAVTRQPTSAATTPSARSPVDRAERGGGAFISRRLLFVAVIGLVGLTLLVVVSVGPGGRRGRRS